MSKILTLGKLDKHRSIFANQKWLHEKLHRRNRIRSSIRKVQPWKRSKTWKLKIKLKKEMDKYSFFQIPSSVKIQIISRKVFLRCKGKTLLGIVNKLLKTFVCWHHPALFCLINSSKLSRHTVYENCQLLTYEGS